MNKINKISIKYGLLAGVAIIAYYLLFYLIRPEMIFQLAIWWGGLIPLLVFQFLGVSKVRMVLDGGISVAEGLRTAFFVYILGVLLFYIFYFVLLKYIDPDLILAQKEIALRNLEKMNAGKSKDLEQFKEYYEQDQPEVTLKGLLFRYVQSLIAGFILSLGIAYIFRTK